MAYIVRAAAGQASYGFHADSFNWRLSI